MDYIKSKKKNCCLECQRFKRKLDTFFSITMTKAKRRAGDRKKMSLKSWKSLSRIDCPRTKSRRSVDVCMPNESKQKSFLEAWIKSQESFAMCLVESEGNHLLQSGQTFNSYL